MGYLKRLGDKILKKDTGGKTPIDGLTKDEDEYSPEDIIIKFRIAPGEDAMDRKHDFCHIPTEDEIKEEFGPGVFSIYAKMGGRGKPKQKRRFKIEGNPWIPVKNYEVKVRINEGGKLLDPEATFPGPKPPIKGDIINSLGGGGVVKLNALGSDGKIIWSEWLDYTDVPPSPELLRQEESFEGKLRQKIVQKKEEAEDEVLAEIGGEKTGNKFDVAVNKLIDTLEDKKLEKLEGAIERFGEKISNPGIGEKSDSEKGLTEIAFKEPYLMKLKAQEKIITELAKTDPEAAIRALEKMPDGVTIGLKLALAGTGLVEAFTDYMKEQSHTKRRGESGKQRGSEKEMHGKAEAEKEKEEGAEAEKMKEQLERESAIGMHEQKSEEGFEIKFDIGEGI